MTRFGRQFAPEVQFARLPGKIIAADRRTIGRIKKS